MSEQVLVFMLAGQRFALATREARECLPLPRLWRRPGTPAHVAGFFSLGGTVLPVLDLAHLLGLRDGGATLLLEADGLYRHLIRLDRVALLVDRVIALAVAVPAPPDPRADDWQHGCVAGRLLLDGEPVALLDAGRLLLEDERALLDRLADAARQRAEDWTIVDG